MASHWCILIDLALLWFFFGNWILDHVLPRKALLKRRLKAAAKSLKNRILRDADLLDAKALGQAREFLLELGKGRKEAPEVQEKLLKRFQDDLQLPEFRHDGAIASNLEVLLVSIGVAFGIRSLFISPFRIPTGSMQPTLYGIHFVELSDEEMPQSRLAALFDGINYSRSYFRLEAPEDGVLEFDDIHGVPSKPFFPKSAVPFRCKDGTIQDLVIPTDAENAKKVLFQILSRRYATMGPVSTVFHKGELLAQGAIESGDSLFVNRLSLCFHEPSRGDIMVFSTEDLSYNGQNLAGVFYVKRLVGLPGDTLKIQDRTLFVRPEGQTEFFPLDGTYSRPFERIHAQKDGYTGHSVQPNAAHLRFDGDEYTVPDGMYFLMGDNTDNSLDCRFFGPVARKRLVGTPCFVWWPFSKRLGTNFDNM